MSLVRHRSRNHPQQVKRKGKDDSVDDRRTPDSLWLPLHAEFQFTLDAAATAENTKCPRFCKDGLAESWSGERVWCNPPFSDIRPWVLKAWDEVSSSHVIVMLLPSNRTEQAWWQDYVEPFRDRDGCSLTTRFLRGRPRFDRPGWVKPKKGDRPPFGLVILIWRGSR